jgi:hypothetical protein
MKKIKSLVWLYACIISLVSIFSCTRTRYRGFTVSEITMETGLQGITVGNNYFLKFEGAEINDETDRITIFPNFTSATFYPNFSADKEQEEYKITLMREEGSNEYEVYSFDIQFIDYAGQESFTMSPGDGYKFQFKMSWPAVW